MAPLNFGYTRPRLPRAVIDLKHGEAVPWDRAALPISARRAALDPAESQRVRSPGSARSVPCLIALRLRPFSPGISGSARGLAGIVLERIAACASQRDPDREWLAGSAGRKSEIGNRESVIGNLDQLALISDLIYLRQRSRNSTVTVRQTRTGRPLRVAAR